MPTRPSGTVAFLFSDVVGSTRLWEMDRRGMAASLASHDRIVEDCIDDLDGYVFSTAGDSFAAAFPTPDAALSAAMRAQLGLLEEPWPGPPISIRIGVHTGTSFERGGDYFGPDVNRAARVMAAANAGQVLVSGATAELVGRSVSAPMSLIDRGVHALKDLERPEHLYELLHPDLPEVLDPLRTALVQRVHLPARLTSFVGRKQEIEVVKRLVESSRLVTLTGVGGAGKTRLALEVASGLEDAFPDGIWMAALADISESGLVVNELAEVWNLRPGDGMGLLQVIKAYLADRKLLVVLDNCEHVLLAAAGLATDLLASSPGLAILATSRETLGVPGETVYRVPSLGLPTEGSDLTASESVRLFVDRATLIEPSFNPTPEELEAIARICRRLDGIPLGIELAAARIRTLTITDLAAQLERSFRILTAASKTAVRRQRTLENTIGWSYDLLTEEEASLFRRLSVFAGGFDLAAAQVLGKGPDVLDLLDQLVDKSLVVAGRQDRVSRFRLLEPMRQYGQMRLVDEGEEDEVRSAHAEYFSSRVATTAPRLRGPEQAQANRELLIEADNIRTALGTFRDSGEMERFLETCFDLTWFWAQSSMHVEGRDILVAALEELGDLASRSVVAKAWLEAALLAAFLSDPVAADFSDQGLEVARDSGEEALIGWLTLCRGMIYSTLVQIPEAESWLEEGRQMIAQNRDHPMWAPTWDDAMVEFMLAVGGGASPENREHVAEAIARASDIGDEYLAAAAMMTSTSLIGTGQDKWVLDNLSRSTEIFGGLGSRHGLGHALYYHGGARQDLGIEVPIEDLADASRILAEVGDLPCSTRAAARFVRALIDAGRIAEAKDQLAAAAERLLLADDASHTGRLPALGLHLAMAERDLNQAARLVGHLERRPVGLSQEALTEARAEVESGLSDAEHAKLVAEGAAADYRQVLGWLREGH